MELTAPSQASSKPIPPQKILLVRLIPDSCEAYIPYGTTIEFSWAELGLDLNSRIKVINDHQTTEVPSIPPSREHQCAEEQ